MKDTFKTFLYDLLLVILFTYGVFYTSYKFGRPDLGNHDFVKYSKMVDSPMNMGATRAPFVLRQLPTLVAYGIKQAGIYYPNKVSFRDAVYYTDENSQRNFFALILSNYIAVVLAITLLVRFLKAQDPAHPTVHFVVLALCLGYFMLQLNIIAPLTQGYGWLATVLIGIGMADRKYVPVVLGTFTAILSRETVVLFFIVFALSAFVYTNRKGGNAVFLRNTCIIMLSSVLLMVAVRVLYTTGNSGQLSPIHLLGQTLQSMSNADYFFQAFLTQGLLAYVLIGVYKKAKPAAMCYSIALLFIILISGFGVGRIIGEGYPLLVMLYCLPVNNHLFTKI